MIGSLRAGATERSVTVVSTVGTTGPVSSYVDETDFVGLSRQKIGFASTA